MARNFIKKAIKHPGALRRSLGVKKGRKISAKQLTRAAHSRNATTRRRAALAKTLRRLARRRKGRSKRKGY